MPNAGDVDFVLYAVGLQRILAGNQAAHDIVALSVDVGHIKNQLAGILSDGYAGTQREAVVLIGRADGGAFLLKDSAAKRNLG